MTESVMPDSWKESIPKPVLDDRPILGRPTYHVDGTTPSQQ